MGNSTILGSLGLGLNIGWDLIKLAILYFVIKYAVKSAINESQIKSRQ
ncbi:MULTISPECIES: DUF6019 family protein [Tissierellales]|jgi:F0F1-type ATP synthase membrane subunit b/b'|nr:MULTISPECIES: DUF6019 family protein [Tissierellales]SCL81918.1 hypothetical protein PP176A_0159 [Sporanaerobacter sp. PP17-6a]